MVQQLFLSHKGYKISDDVLLVPLSRDPKDKVRAGGGGGRAGV